MKRLSLLSLQRSDPNYEAVVREYFQRTYQSSWNFLVHAARSNLIHAAVETRRLAEIFIRAVQRDQRPAETLVVMNCNYSFLLAGPLLGTILSASGALEAFLRMAARAFFERSLTKQKRGAGTSNELSQELAEFDEKSVLDKLDFLYDKVLHRQCDDALRGEFKHLVEFRNDCFHADPVLRLKTGDDETTKRGRRRPVPLSRGIPPQYPLLWASNRPLSLNHALRAARVHDGVVRELLGTPSLGCLRDILGVGDDWQIHFIEGVLPKQISPEVLEKRVKLWNKLEQDLQDVSLDDQRLYLLDLQRKKTIRSVK